MRVKICGVRDQPGVRACIQGRADFAGLNFAPRSRRRLSVAQAQPLSAALRDGEVAPVGVFQDADEAQVLEVVAALGLSWVQLHGDEPAALCERLRARSLRVIKALDLARAQDDALIDSLAPHVDIFLIDGRQAGSGRAWSWGAAAKLAALRVDNGRGARLGGRPLWLAGGLNPENVAAAIAQTTPVGVDTASGVEREGRQDPARILAFCQAARQV